MREALGNSREQEEVGRGLLNYCVRSQFTSLWLLLDAAALKWQCWGCCDREDIVLGFSLANFFLLLAVLLVVMDALHMSHPLVKSAFLHYLYVLGVSLIKSRLTKPSVLEATFSFTRQIWFQDVMANLHCQLHCI